MAAWGYCHLQAILAFFPSWAVEKFPSTHNARNVCKGKNVGSASCPLPAPWGAQRGTCMAQPCPAGLQDPSPSPLPSATERCRMRPRQRPSGCRKMCLQRRACLVLQEAAQGLCFRPLGKPGVATKPLQTACMLPSCDGILTETVVKCH